MSFSKRHGVDLYRSIGSPQKGDKRQSHRDLPKPWGSRSRGKTSDERTLIQRPTTGEREQEQEGRVHRGGLSPLAFLAEIPFLSLLEIVQKESETDLTLILAALPSRKAACLLERLPVTKQRGTIRRMAHLRTLPPATLERVAERIRRETCYKEGECYHKIDGQATLARILRHMDSQGVQRIIASLETSAGPALVRRIRGEIFTWNLLNVACDRELQKLLMRYSNREVALLISALELEKKGASERVRTNLSSRRRVLVKEEMSAVASVSPLERKRVKESFLGALFHRQEPSLQI